MAKKLPEFGSGLAIVLFAKNPKETPNKMFYGLVNLKPAGFV